MSWRSRWLGILLATSIAALVFYFLFQRGFVRFQYPPIDDYPVRGVDVSHHQNEIDWAELVSESKIRFAFIKATEGTDLSDRRFQENWKASEGRVQRGAYHFFTFCTPGVAQARNFLSAAPEAGELPRAIDVEFSGNCTAWRSIGAIRRELERFVEVVRLEDGRDPILYLTRETYKRIVSGHFDGVPLWIRKIVFRPSPEEYPGLAFWQYAGNGRLDGVDTLVDLNVFVGDRQTFEKFLTTPGG